MSRKPLLLSLFVLLALAVTWVIISSLRTAPPPLTSAPRHPTNVRQSASSPTRVLFPRDLEILESTSEWVRQAGGLIAKHKVVIRNKGKVAYNNAALEISYLDARGKILDTRTYTAGQLLRAAETVSLMGIEMPGLPVSTAKSTLKVIHADLVSAEIR